MSISSEAVSDQGNGGYNADSWKDTVLPVGMLLYAGYSDRPDFGRYFTDRETVLANADGQFSFVIWGVLQVRPHTTKGDRQMIRELRVAQECPCAAGSATANAGAYWGGGGGYQFFIPDRFHGNLRETRIVPLNTTGLL